MSGVPRIPRNLESNHGSYLISGSSQIYKIQNSMSVFCGFTFHDSVLCLRATPITYFAYSIPRFSETQNVFCLCVSAYCQTS